MKFLKKKLKFIKISLLKKTQIHFLIIILRLIFFFLLGFHGGAANLLFKQKKQIIDVLVELETSKIETSCPELRRQLFLTTEDLRFGERLIRGIIDPTSCEADYPSNYTSEEWIRMQFTIYILSLLRTSLMEGTGVIKGQDVCKLDNVLLNCRGQQGTRSFQRSLRECVEEDEEL